MSMPLNWDRVHKAISEKDTSPALILDITEHVVDNMLHYRIQVIKQKYRSSRFYNSSDSFTASNDFTLSSVSCPAGSIHNTGSSCESRLHMYVRGTDKSMDQELLATRSLGYIEKLKQAVKEYNEER